MILVNRQLDADGSGIIELNEFVDWWVQRSARSRSNGGLIAMKLRKLARKAAQLYFTDIFTAVWNNDILLVRTFLESDRRVGSASDVSEYGDGWMPLHYSCYRGYLPIAKELVEIGVNINATNDLGFSALFYAAQNGFIEICEFLLVNGADPGVSGTSPDGKIFMCAVDHSIDNEDLKYLFESHKSCTPPDQPPSNRITVSIKENKGILSIELPPSRSISQLPIKRWHIILSTSSSTRAPSDSFETYVDGLNPSKQAHGNDENTLQVTIDKKWISSKTLSDGSMPNLILKISGIDPLGAESPFSDEINVAVDSTISRNISIILSPPQSKSGMNVDNTDDNDDYLGDDYDTNEDGPDVEDEEIDRLRREIDGDEADIGNDDMFK